MHNGYAQTEGAANLELAPPAGYLFLIGYPKFKGGVGQAPAMPPSTRRTGRMA